MNSFGFFKIKSCFWLTRVELGTSGTHLAPVIPAKELELAGGCIKVTHLVPVLYYTMADSLFRCCFGMFIGFLHLSKYKSALALKNLYCCLPFMFMYKMRGSYIVSYNVLT